MPVGNSSRCRGRLIGGVLAFNLPELMLSTISYRRALELHYLELNYLELHFLELCFLEMLSEDQVKPCFQLATNNDIMICE